MTHLKLRILTVFALLSIAGAGLHAAPNNQPADVKKAVDRLVQAELNYNRKDLQQSIDLFTRWTKENPQNARYPYYLARAYFPLITLYEAGGDLAKAESEGEKGMEFAREAVRRDATGNADAYRLLGDFYGRLTSFKSIFGRMEYGGKGQKHHAKALEMAPENMLAVIGVGTDKLYAPAGFGGDVDAAVKLFEKAAQMSPDSALPLVWLAKAYAKDGKRDLANATLQRALLIQPDCALAKIELENNKAAAKRG